MVHKKWFTTTSLLVILVLLWPVGTIARELQSPVSLPGDGESSSPYLLALSSNSALGVSAAAVLGEPGLNFRYAETFGETEMAYFTDTLHINYPFGLGTDGTDVWIADSEGSRVLKCASGGSCETFIGKAGFHFPCEETELDWIADVGVDGSGNVWVVDSGAHHVVKFDSNGNYVSELGQTWQPGSANDQFDNPRGIAFDGAGNIYVSDAGNHRVQVFDSSGVYTATIGVSGVPTSTNNGFDQPEHIAVDSGDNLYVADYNNHRVQVFDSSSVYTATIGVSGVPSSTHGYFENPLGVAVDANYIYVADARNHRVQIFHLATHGWQGKIGLDSAGSDNARFDYPSDVVVDLSGNIYVADYNNTRVQQFNISRVYQHTYGTTGEPYQTDGEHYNTPHVAIDGSDHIIILEEHGQRLIKLDAGGVPQWGEPVGEAGVAGSDNEHFNDPHGVAVDGDGRIYVADSGNHRVQIYGSDGVYSTTLGTGQGPGDEQFDRPTGIAVGADGRIYVSDTDNHRVEIYASDLQLVGRIGITGVCNTDNTHLCHPAGIIVDRNGSIYVADTDNCRVQKFNGAGIWQMTLGTTGNCGDDFSQLDKPEDVTVDAQGRIYVADTWNHRVQIFDSAGAYLTTIGGAEGGNSGQLRGASGVDVDSVGNVYVADLQNARIQKFAPGTPGGWKQANINGFGYRTSSMVTALNPFGGQLYAGMSNADTGAQLWRYSPDAAWTAVFTDGLGNSDNVTVDHLIEFSHTLYAGTRNDPEGGQIWRSASGDPGDWQMVVSGGFTSTSNSEISHFTVFSDQIYAATWNQAAGGELWRSSSGDGGAWLLAMTGGFDDPDNQGLVSLVQFNGDLYVGTVNTDTGGELWRSSSGISWTQAITDGFGSADNDSISSLAVFNGYLYAGCSNEISGAQIWRSPDGMDWTQVESSGFGNTETQGLNALEVFDGQLYFFVGNVVTGVEVWRTSNGTDWGQVGFAGFGDSNNYATYWGNATTVFDESLYVGTSNLANGGEVWLNKSYDIYLPLVLKNYATFVNPYEDHDSFGQAYGPLASGASYSAYPDDSFDFYYVVLDNPTTVTAQVTDYQAEGQMRMYDQNESAIGDLDWNDPDDPGDKGDGVMTVGPLSLESGKYYIRIYTAPESQHTSALYTLEVTY
jgi:uncharacterized protein YjiK